MTHQNDPKYDFVKNTILEKVVKGYIVGDLRKMLGIEVDPNAHGNLNFPIALYTFTSLEYLGYLVSSRPLTELNGHGYTQKRILDFITHHFSAQDKAEVFKLENEFVKMFRHGLAHEFFPKMSAGISRTNSTLWSKSRERGSWVLDADIFANMFINSIPNLESKIEETDFYLRVYERYHLKIEDTPENLLTTTTTFTGPSSGPHTTTLLPRDNESLDGDMGSINLPYSQGDTGVAGIDEDMSE
ncbi:hypothetical protein [Candidatus Leptofilum sp.]|uniref:hypothetical protein n=1 Tax=Candidatus Leptofilum sp. TaxID=3241576 RepID=UPI003B59FE39